MNSSYEYAATCSIVDELLLDTGIDSQDRLLAAERARGGLGEPVDADDDELAVLDLPHPLGVAAHEPALQLVDRLSTRGERRAKY